MLRVIILTVLLSLSSQSQAHRLPNNQVHQHVLDQEFLNRKDPVELKKVKPQPVAETPLEQYPQFLGFLNDHYDERYIIVNRGSQQLVVIDDMEVILSMRVIVGKKGWKTPLATTSITHIITNPSWNVPRSIVPEMVAKIKRDVAKYERIGYQVLYKDQSYPAEYVNFFEEKEIGIKQMPGQWNVLGKVKFSLSGVGAIFMHDTSGRYKFKRTNRKLSHGCIRLEKPLKLMNTISSITYIKETEKWHRLKTPMSVYIVDWGKSGN